MKKNERRAKQDRIDDESKPQATPAEKGGDFQRAGIGGVERKVKSFFSVFTSARKEVENTEEMKKTRSRLDYKLAQRLDSAEFTDLAQEVAEISEKKKGDGFMAGLWKRTMGQRFAMGGLGIVSVVFLFSFVALGIVWYRGTDIPILRNLFDQSSPVLAMEKDIETEYGVAPTDNKFYISRSDGVSFRSLGIAGRVVVIPEIDFSVDLSDDNMILEVVPLEDLDPDTEYRVIVKEGTLFSDGVSLAQDYSWVFRTEPTFTVSAITPRDGTDTAPFDTTIEVEFTYKDIDPAAFQAYFEIVPPVDGRFELHGKKLVFVPGKDLVKGTVYRVIVREGFSNSRGERLVRNFESVFKVSSYDSTGKYVEQTSMYWSESSSILSTTRDPWLGLNTNYLSGDVKFTLYKASKEAVVDVMKDFQWEIYDKPDPSTIVKVREFSRASSDLRFFEVELEEYGIYFLEAYNASYGRSIYKFFVYSPVGMLLSDAKGSDCAWLFNMNEKEPLSGGDVYYYDFDTADIPVHTATTDANGYVMMEDGTSELVIADYSGNYAVALSGRYMSSSMWWLGGWNPVGGDELNHRAFVYMDRPLYRPGDMVHYKIVVREEDDMSYGIPENEVVTVQVGNSYYGWNGYRNLPYYEETIDISSQFGTAVGEFEVPSSITTGSETLSAVVDGVVVGSTTFTVAEFEKPRFQFSMNIDKTLAFGGDTVHVEVSGTDYSGDPAAGARVVLDVSRGEVGVNWLDYPEELNREQMQYYGVDTVADEALTLDSDGRAEYSFPVDVSDYATKLGVYSIHLRPLEDYVNHDNETVIVSDKDTVLFIKPEEWSVVEGGENTVTFKTVKLWDFDVVGGVRVEYDLDRKWTEWVETGDYYDPATKTRKPVYSPESHSETVFSDREVILDTEGLGTDELIDLPHGSYTVYATYYVGEDVFRKFENVFYVYGEPEDGQYIYSDWGYADQNFKLYFDKEEYNVGETAEITLKTTLAGNGVFLVTRGEVYEWKPVDFSSGIVKIQQEITDDMAPWVQFCAWGIEEYVSSEIPDEGISQQYLSNVFVSDCSQISVNHDYGRLDVEVYPDKETYEPGDEVSLNIRVSDSAGKGISSEVSLSVVDRALLDLVRESYGFEHDIYDGFYSQVRQIANQRGAPFPYSYGGYGAGGGGDVPVRSNFADSAFWNGRVTTDASGNAQVSFELPDNLTSWVAKATAVTEDTWVGDGYADFIARKDVRLDARVPNFIRSEDMWKMDLDVVNYSTSALNGKVSLSCEECVQTTSTQDVMVFAGERKTVEMKVQPKNGAVDVLNIEVRLQEGDTVHDAVEWAVPVVADGFIQNDAVAVLLEEGVETGSVEFVLPGGADLSDARLDLTASRSFVNEWALVPVDPSVSSSVELAGSIIHNSLFVKHYDEIRPSEPQKAFEQKITSALDLLAGNQAENGGYGWFDYDAVNYELSAYVGLALGRAGEVGLVPEGGRVDNLGMYLKEGLDSGETNVDEKILAVYALSVLGDSSALPYALHLKNNSDEFSDSPLDIAHLMLALQEFGSVGDAGELIDLLENTAERSQRVATWVDPDVEFRVVRTADYTTAIVYQALSSYENLTLSDMARAWLVENPVPVHGNSVDAVAILYALTTGSMDNVAGRKGTNTVTVSVNGMDVRTFDVGGDEDWVGKVDLLIPPGFLRQGKNVIQVERDSGGELYVAGNVSYYGDSLEGQDEFAVVRTIKDFETGQPVTEVDKGDIVVIGTRVRVDRDGYNLMVHDFMPAGFEPVQYQLGEFDYLFYKKWWKWGDSSYVNRS